MVSRTTVIEAPFSVIWDVVTDVEKYPEFLKEVKTVRIEKREGETVTAAHQIEIIKMINYTLDLTKDLPNKRFLWTLVKGQLITKNDGYWEFVEQGPARCSATYNIDIKFGLLVPSSITNMLTEVNLPKTLDAFKKRAESVYKKSLG